MIHPLSVLRTIQGEVNNIIAVFELTSGSSADPLRDSLKDAFLSLLALLPEDCCLDHTTVFPLPLAVVLAPFLHTLATPSVHATSSLRRVALQSLQRFLQADFLSPRSTCFVDVVGAASYDFTGAHNAMHDARTPALPLPPSTALAQCLSALVRAACCVHAGAVHATQVLHTHVYTHLLAQALAPTHPRADSASVLASAPYSALPEDSLLAHVVAYPHPARLPTVSTLVHACTAAPTSAAVADASAEGAEGAAGVPPLLPPSPALATVPPTHAPAPGSAASVPLLPLPASALLLPPPAADEDAQALESAALGLFGALVHSDALPLLPDIDGFLLFAHLHRRAVVAVEGAPCFDTFEYGFHAHPYSTLLAPTQPLVPVVEHMCRLREAHAARPRVRALPQDAQDDMAAMTAALTPLMRGHPALYTGMHTDTGAAPSGVFPPLPPLPSPHWVLGATACSAPLPADPTHQRYFSALPQSLARVAAATLADLYRALFQPLGQLGQLGHLGGILGGGPAGDRGGASQRSRNPTTKPTHTQVHAALEQDSRPLSLDAGDTAHATAAPPDTAPGDTRQPPKTHTRARSRPLSAQSRSSAACIPHTLTGSLASSSVHAHIHAHTHTHTHAHPFLSLAAARHSTPFPSALSSLAPALPAALPLTGPADLLYVIPHVRTHTHMHTAPLAAITGLQARAHAPQWSHAQNQARVVSPISAGDTDGRGLAATALATDVPLMSAITAARTALPGPATVPVAITVDAGWHTGTCLMPSTDPSSASSSSTSLASSSPPSPWMHLPVFSLAERAWPLSLAAGAGRQRAEWVTAAVRAREAAATAAEADAPTVFAAGKAAVAVSANAVRNLLPVQVPPHHGLPLLHLLLLLPSMHLTASARVVSLLRALTRVPSSSGGGGGLTTRTVPWLRALWFSESHYYACVRRDTHARPAAALGAADNGVADDVADGGESFASPAPLARYCALPLPLLHVGDSDVAPSSALPGTVHAHTHAQAQAPAADVHTPSTPSLPSWALAVARGVPGNPYLWPHPHSHPHERPTRMLPALSLSSFSLSPQLVHAYVQHAPAPGVPLPAGLSPLLTALTSIFAPHATLALRLICAAVEVTGASHAWYHSECATHAAHTARAPDGALPAKLLAPPVSPLALWPALLEPLRETLSRGLVLALSAPHPTLLPLALRTLATLTDALAPAIPAPVSVLHRVVAAHALVAVAGRPLVPSLLAALTHSHTHTAARAAPAPPAPLLPLLLAHLVRALSRPHLLALFVNADTSPRARIPYIVLHAVPDTSAAQSTCPPIPTAPTDAAPTSVLLVTPRMPLPGPLPLLPALLAPLLALAHGHTLGGTRPCNASTNPGTNASAGPSASAGAMSLPFGAEAAFDAQLGLPAALYAGDGPLLPPAARAACRSTGAHTAPPPSALVRLSPGTGKALLARAADYTAAYDSPACWSSARAVARDPASLVELGIPTPDAARLPALPALPVLPPVPPALLPPPSALLPLAGMLTGTLATAPHALSALLSHSGLAALATAALARALATLTALGLDTRALRAATATRLRTGVEPIHREHAPARNTTEALEVPSTPITTASPSCARARSCALPPRAVAALFNSLGAKAIPALVCARALIASEEAEARLQTHALSALPAAAVAAEEDREQDKAEPAARAGGPVDASVAPESHAPGVSSTEFTGVTGFLPIASSTDTNTDTGSMAPHGAEHTERATTQSTTHFSGRTVLDGLGAAAAAPRSLALFLLHHPGLSKQVIGECLGQPGAAWERVLREYCRLCPMGEPGGALAAEEHVRNAGVRHGTAKAAAASTSTSGARAWSTAHIPRVPAMAADHWLPSWAAAERELDGELRGDLLALQHACARAGRRSFVNMLAAARGDGTRACDGVPAASALALTNLHSPSVTLAVQPPLMRQLWRPGALTPAWLAVYDWGSWLTLSPCDAEYVRMYRRDTCCWPPCVVILVDRVLSLVEQRCAELAFSARHTSATVCATDSTTGTGDSPTSASCAGILVCLLRDTASLETLTALVCGDPCRGALALPADVCEQAGSSAGSDECADEKMVDPIDSSSAALLSSTSAGADGCYLRSHWLVELRALRRAVLAGTAVDVAAAHDATPVACAWLCALALMQACERWFIVAQARAARRAAEEAERQRRETEERAARRRRRAEAAKAERGDVGHDNPAPAETECKQATGAPSQSTSPASMPPQEPDAPAAPPCSSGTAQQALHCADTDGPGSAGGAGQLSLALPANVASSAATTPTPVHVADAPSRAVAVALHVPIVPALRAFLSRFRLPGEAQQIARVVEAFAHEYYRRSPAFFANVDAVYVLAYSVVLLNTDLHKFAGQTQGSKAVGMSQLQYIRNVKGTNGGGDVPASYLAAVYADVSARAFEVDAEFTKRSHGAISCVRELVFALQAPRGPTNAAAKPVETGAAAALWRACGSAPAGQDAMQAPAPLALWWLVSCGKEGAFGAGRGRWWRRWVVGDGDGDGDEDEDEEHEEHDEEQNQGPSALPVSTALARPSSSWAASWPPALITLAAQVAQLLPLVLPLLPLTLCHMHCAPGIRAAAEAAAHPHTHTHPPQDLWALCRSLRADPMATCADLSLAAIQRDAELTITRWRAATTVALGSLLDAADAFSLHRLRDVVARCAMHSLMLEVATANRQVVVTRAESPAQQRALTLAALRDHCTATNPDYARVLVATDAHIVAPAHIADAAKGTEPTAEQYPHVPHTPRSAAASAAPAAPAVHYTTAGACAETMFVLPLAAVAVPVPGAAPAAPHSGLLPCDHLPALLALPPALAAQPLAPLLLAVAHAPLATLLLRCLGTRVLPALIGAGTCADAEPEVSAPADIDAAEAGGLGCHSSHVYPLVRRPAPPPAALSALSPGLTLVITLAVSGILPIAVHPLDIPAVGPLSLPTGDDGASAGRSLALAAWLPTPGVLAPAAATAGSTAAHRLQPLSLHLSMPAFTPAPALPLWHLPRPPRRAALPTSPASGSLLSVLASMLWTTSPDASPSSPSHATGTATAATSGLSAMPAARAGLPTSACSAALSEPDTPRTTSAGLSRLPEGVNAPPVSPVLPVSPVTPATAWPRRRASTSTNSTNTPTRAPVLNPSHPHAPAPSMAPLALFPRVLPDNSPFAALHRDPALLPLPLPLLPATLALLQTTHTAGATISAALACAPAPMLAAVVHLLAAAAVYPPVQAHAQTGKPASNAASAVALLSPAVCLSLLARLVVHMHSRAHAQAEATAPSSTAAASAAPSTPAIPAIPAATLARAHGLLLARVHAVLAAASAEAESEADVEEDDAVADVDAVAPADTWASAATSVVANSGQVLHATHTDVLTADVFIAGAVALLEATGVAVHPRGRTDVAVAAQASCSAATLSPVSRSHWPTVAAALASRRNAPQEPGTSRGPRSPARDPLLHSAVCALACLPDALLPHARIAAVTDTDTDTHTDTATDAAAQLPVWVLPGRGDAWCLYAAARRAPAPLATVPSLAAASASLLGPVAWLGSLPPALAFRYQPHTALALANLLARGIFPGDRALARAHQLVARWAARTAGLAVRACEVWRAATYAPETDSTVAPLPTPARAVALACAAALVFLTRRTAALLVQHTPDAEADADASEGPWAAWTACGASAVSIGSLLQLLQALAHSHARVVQAAGLPASCSCSGCITGQEPGRVHPSPPAALALPNLPAHVLPADHMEPLAYALGPLAWHDACTHARTLLSLTNPGSARAPACCLSAASLCCPSALLAACLSRALRWLPLLPRAEAVRAAMYTSMAASLATAPPASPAACCSAATSAEALAAIFPSPSSSPTLLNPAAATAAAAALWRGAAGALLALTRGRVSEPPAASASANASAAAAPALATEVESGLEAIVPDQTSEGSEAAAGVTAARTATDAGVAPAPPSPAPPTSPAAGAAADAAVPGCPGLAALAAALLTHVLRAYTPAQAPASTAAPSLPAPCPWAMPVLTHFLLRDLIPAARATLLAAADAAPTAVGWLAFLRTWHAHTDPLHAPSATLPSALPTASVLQVPLLCLFSAPAGAPFPPAVLPLAALLALAQVLLPRAPAASLRTLALAVLRDALAPALAALARAAGRVAMFHTATPQPVPPETSEIESTPNECASLLQALSHAAVRVVFTPAPAAAAAPAANSPLLLRARALGVDLLPPLLALPLHPAALAWLHSSCARLGIQLPRGGHAVTSPPCPERPADQPAATAAGSVPPSAPLSGDAPATPPAVAARQALRTNGSAAQAPAHAAPHEAVHEAISETSPSARPHSAATGAAQVPVAGTNPDTNSVVLANGVNEDSGRAAAHASPAAIAEGASHAAGNDGNCGDGGAFAAEHACPGDGAGDAHSCLPGQLFHAIPADARDEGEHTAIAHEASGPASVGVVADEAFCHATTAIAKHGPPNSPQGSLLGWLGLW